MNNTAPMFSTINMFELFWYLAGFTTIAVGLMLIVREAVLWYWKINRIESLLQKIVVLLDQQNRSNNPPK